MANYLWFVLNVTLLSVDSEPVNNEVFYTIRFMLKNKLYWIESSKVLHINGQDGQLALNISYWNKFLLSLDNNLSHQEKSAIRCVILEPCP